jgi:TP901 family phage tail tape measure protein
MEEQRAKLDALTQAFEAGEVSQKEYAQSFEEVTQAIAKTEAQQAELANETEQTKQSSAKLEQSIAKLNDEFKKGLITQREYEQGLNKIDQEARTAGAGIGDFIRSIRDQYSGGNTKNELGSLALQYVGIGAAVEGARRIIGSAVNTVLEFDSALARIRALGGEYAKNIDRIGDASKTAGTQFGFTATQSLSAAEALAKSGVQTEDILGGALTGALTLAAAGTLEVGEAAEVAANTMTQFGLAGTDVTKIADLLAAGANSATGDVGDFAQALKQSGLVASQFGLSVEETVGTLTAFASAGLLGSDSGTSFRTMLLRLAKPSEEAAATMERLGVAAFDAEGSFVGIEDLAGQLKTQLAGLTEEQRNAALATIFGADAIRAASILYEQGSEGVAKWTKEVNKTGFGARVAAEQQDTLQGAIDRSNSAWEGFVLGVEDGSGVIGTAIKSVIQAYTGLLQLLTPDAADRFGEGVQGQLKGINNELSKGIELSNSFAEEQIRFASERVRGLESIGNAERQLLNANARRAKVLQEINALEANESTLSAQGVIKLAVYRQELGAIDKIIQAKGGSAKASGELAEAEKKGSLDAINAAETVALARQRLTAEIKAEKDSREALAATDTAAIAGADKRIAQLEKELAALDGKTQAVIKLTEADQKQLDLMREMQALAEQAAEPIEPRDLLATAEPQRLGLDSANPADLVEGEINRLREELRIADIAGVADYNLQRELLDQEYYDGRIASLEEYNARKKAIDQAEAVTTVAAATDLLGSLQQLSDLGFDQKVANLDAQQKTIQEKIANATSEAQRRELEDQSKRIDEEKKALDERKKITQGFAVASALINTYLSATQAMAQVPFPANIAAATAAIISGLVNVAKIKGFADGGEISGDVKPSWGPRVNRSNGDNVLARAGKGFVTLKTGEKVLNEKQQRKAEQLAGPGFWGAIGLPGYSGTMDRFRSAMFKGGYADGGTVGIVTPRPTPSMIVQSTLAAEMAEANARPIYASYVEFSDVESRVQTIEGARTL